MSRRAAALLSIVFALGVLALHAQAPAGVAYLAVDAATNKPIETIRPDQIDTPIAPGSVVKIATLAAALESGVITPQSGVLCTREISIDGHRLICTHPDLHRPLRPAEALAHSCNVFFATVGARLSRPAFDDALLRLGLSPSDPAFPLAAAALGIEGVRASPRRLLEMMTRVAAEPNRLSWKPATLSVVREGLQGAAKFGTASALAARGVDAMAKTGTVVTASGPRGLVVGVTRATTSTALTRRSTGFVLLASGGAGVDAAALAADRLAPRQSAIPQTVGIGVARPGGGYDIRQMPLEEYVAGVVAGEMAAASGGAALEALAITVRTYALANLGRHAADKFDLCDLTHCQVLRKPTPATLRAAAATAGRVLLDKNAPAQVFYSASCGGHTERPSAVWPGAADPPFLPSREDDACAGEPAWSAHLTVLDLDNALHNAGFKGDLLRNLTIVARDNSHRVTRLRLDGFTPSEISGPDFRTVVGRTLGWQYLKSTAFDLKHSGPGFFFEGHGSGHGVGLCVIGSKQLAARGQSADAILARYFPGLTISALIPNAGSDKTRPAYPAPPSGVAVSLPEGDQEERAVVQALALHARDALMKQLGVPAPAQLTLRFYPTVESYERATGKPWFTSGATVGAQMHFIPLASLHQRGILEQTVRHEMVHVLTEEALAGRPLWVREGAALYYAGETSGGTGARVTCPTDQELLQPSSPGALGLAYERAGACFAGQLRAGKTWRDIR